MNFAIFAAAIALTLPLIAWDRTWEPPPDSSGIRAEDLDIPEPGEGCGTRPGCAPD